MQSESLIAATAATASWQYSQSLPIHAFNQCSLDIAFLKGAATTLYIIVQFSHDRDVWFTDQLQNVGSDYADYKDLQRRFTEDGNKSVQFGISHLHMRVGYKVNADGTGAVVGVRATLNERTY